MNESRFDPNALLQTLVRNRVRFVVIGMLAGRLLGSSVLTRDLDICYARDRENLEALASALRELGARLRGVKEDVPFKLDARTLRNGDSFMFVTDLGDLDCLGTPAGTSGYEDLARRAVTLDIDNVSVAVASVDDLIRMKRAAGRPRDRMALDVLLALREEIEKMQKRP